MSKKIGNIPLSKEAIEGLKGFEDVFEDYVDSEEYKELERKERENSKAGEQYELQLFLEQENARLTGLEVFLTKKISLKTNFSQTDKILQQQVERKNILKEKMISEFKKLDSAFQKNLAQIFNSHFS
ncbi:MAG: hypothetical protein WC635_00595 [Bacteriovorax sp.]|jgi:hypothetical protein